LRGFSLDYINFKCQKLNCLRFVKNVQRQTDQELERNAAQFQSTQNLSLSCFDVPYV